MWVACLLTQASQRNKTNKNYKLMKIIKYWHSNIIDAIEMQKHRVQGIGSSSFLSDMKKLNFIIKILFCCI
jgi:hypothetical protein